MGTESRPAFYALNVGAWRDYVTVLHPPYTLWHLSYVVLGSAASPQLRMDRMLWTLAAFFLAVGIGAHSLDELNGRPLKTRIRGGVLWGLAGASTISAVAIGAWGAITVLPSLWGFVAFGTFILLAYNLELLRGIFHNDFWFAFAWGAFPFATAYWASAASFNPGAAALAAACFGLSLAQRKLSTQARTVRRRVLRVEGAIEYRNGQREALTADSLIVVAETALRILAVTVPLLALGLLALHLSAS